MASLYVNLAIYLVGLIFAAGILYSRIMRLAKDVNGVGRKVNVIEIAAQGFAGELKIIDGFLTRLEKDLSGIGQKVDAMEKDDRYARIQMAIVAITPEEKKQMVLECLGGKQP